MVCPGCGAGARDDARFCLHCGEPLEGAATDEGATPARAGAGRGDTPTKASAGAQAQQGRTRSDATALAMARTRDGEPAVQDSGHELVDCANCGATNSGRRVLCGRCGADLETGTVSAGRRRPRPSSSDEDTGELPTQRRRRVRPGLVIVALGLLVGATVGALAAMERGPFADPGPAEIAVSFDPEVYPGEPEDLEIGQVLASSTAQPTGDNRFEPAMAADGRLDTAWNSDGELRPDGIGESVRVDLARPSWVAGFVIANGYQRDGQTFLDNARIQRAQVTLADGVVFEVTMLDQPGRQVVRLDEPVLTDRITITVLASFPGRTYEDLGVSELVLRGWPAAGTDLEAWHARQQDQPAG